MLTAAPMCASARSINKLIVEVERVERARGSFTIGAECSIRAPVHGQKIA
jgi:hypothetical protein